MLIKEFSRVGTMTGEIIVSKRGGKYILQIISSGWDIDCTTTRSEIRTFSKLDTIYSLLARYNFTGDIKIPVSNQCSF